MSHVRFNKLCQRCRLHFTGRLSDSYCRGCEADMETLRVLGLVIIGAAAFALYVVLTSAAA